MPIAPSRTFTRAPALQARYPQDVRTLAGRLPPSVSYPAGQVLAEAANIAQRSEVQTISTGGTVSGGTFTITVPNRGTTGNIAYNATAATVQAALEAVIGSGNVVATGGALPGTPVVLTFANEYGNRDVSLFVANSALTGSSPTIAIAETTKGSSAATESYTAVVDGNSDGTQIPKAILLYDVQTDEKGCIVGEFGMNGNGFTVPVAIAGEYQCSLLTGLVANHVTEGNAKKFGRLTSGNAITDSGAVIKIGV